VPLIAEVEIAPQARRANAGSHQPDSSSSTAPHSNDYVWLAANVREDGRYAQRIIIRPFGCRNQIEAEGRLAVYAGRDSHGSVILAAFHKGELAPLQRRRIGPDPVFGRRWELAGCGPVLRRMTAGHSGKVGSVLDLRSCAAHASTTML
jgi:hypothetical protein